MNKILSLGFLVLLLYNMFGHAIGVFFFETKFQTASEVHEEDEFKTIKFPVLSLPYAASWENTNDAAGLFQFEGQFYNIIHQKIENDTAYVTLKTNLSARERFLELANEVTNIYQRNLATQSPFQKAIHSLSDLAKVYWVSPGKILFTFSCISLKVLSFYLDNKLVVRSPFLSLLSPPPEY